MMKKSQPWEDLGEPCCRLKKQHMQRSWDQDPVWHVEGTARRPPWLEQREGAGEREKEGQAGEGAWPNSFRVLGGEQARSLVCTKYSRKRLGV